MMGEDSSSVASGYEDASGRRQEAQSTTVFSEQRDRDAGCDDGMYREYVEGSSGVMIRMCQGGGRCRLGGRGRVDGCDSMSSGGSVARHLRGKVEYVWESETCH